MSALRQKERIFIGVVHPLHISLSHAMHFSDCLNTLSFIGGVIK